MGVSVLQTKIEHCHSLSHSTVWWSTISGSFAKERNWEMDLALYWRKYIFYLLHAFTLTVIRSHSLTYKAPSEHREVSFYSLTLPLIDAWISLSLSVSIFLTDGTCAVTHRSHRLFSDAFVYVRSWLLYICNSFKGNRRQWVRGCCYMGQWMVYVRRVAFKRKRGNDMWTELEKEGWYITEVEKLKYKITHTRGPVITTHAHKANLHLKVLMKHRIMNR